MNRKILPLLLSALLLTAPLTACSPSDENTDTTPTGTGAAEGTGSSADGSGTTAENTDREPLPRYDYMAATVTSSVTMNREDYAGVTLTIPDSLKVEDEDVQNYIENIRFQYRTAVNGTAMVKDKPLSMGDDAYIYYKGFLNGVEFEGGSNWDDAAPHTLGLGSGKFIPGFESSLVGIVPNTTSKTNPAEITVTFPEDYSADLAGKTVIFQVAVEYAVQYTLPEYNRELVEQTLKYAPKKEFYASDEALLDEFEEYVFDHLVKQSQSNVESAKSSALWEHLTAKAQCRDLPAAEIAYYVDVYVSEVEYYYQTYKSYGGEQFQTQYPTFDSFARAYLGLGEDADWREEVTGYAEELVRRDMITHAIAEWEGMESVSSEEYEEQIQYWIDYYASGYNAMTRDEVIQNMGETFLREAALQEKMGKWLLEQVNFTYADGTPLVTATDNKA